MRENFSATDVVVAVLATAALTGIFASQAVPAAAFPTSASANACARWNLSAADFNGCQSLWSTARTTAERQDIEKRFQARGMIIPGSRRTHVNGGGPDAAGRAGNPAGGQTGAPSHLSASPSR